MNTLIRTTITIPEPLFEKMREAAYYRKTTVSGLMRDTMQKTFGTKPSQGTLLKLKGAYTIGGKPATVSRKDIYDRYLGKKMSS